MDNKKFAAALGKSLREYRIQKGLSIAAVAENVNMDCSHLGDIENGKHTPRIDTFFKLVAELNIPEDFIKVLTSEITLSGT